MKVELNQIEVNIEENTVLLSLGEDYELDLEDLKFDEWVEGMVDEHTSNEGGIEIPIYSSVEDCLERNYHASIVRDILEHREEVEIKSIGQIINY